MEEERKKKEQDGLQFPQGKRIWPRRGRDAMPKNMDDRKKRHPTKKKRGKVLCPKKAAVIGEKPQPVTPGRRSKLPTIIGKKHMRTVGLKKARLKGLVDGRAMALEILGGGLFPSWGE